MCCLHTFYYHVTALKASKPRVCLISLHIHYAALHRVYITDSVRAHEVTYQPLSPNELPLKGLLAAGYQLKREKCNAGAKG